jgi:hypothetical protein
VVTGVVEVEDTVAETLAAVVVVVVTGEAVVAGVLPVDDEQEAEGEAVDRVADVVAGLVVATAAAALGVVPVVMVTVGFISRVNGLAVPLTTSDILFSKTPFEVVLL